MRRTLNRFLLAAVLAGGVSLVGCKQDLGERCEIDSDCAEGTCQNDFCSMGTAAKLDAGPDASNFLPADAGAMDVAAPVEAAAPDVAAPPDAPPAAPDLAPDLRPDTAGTAGDGSAGG